jgi:hypothetical protein
MDNQNVVTANQPVLNTPVGYNNVSVNMSIDAWWAKRFWYNWVKWIMYFIPKGTLSLAGGSLVYTLGSQTVFQEPVNTIVARQALLQDILEVEIQGHKYSLWLASPRFRGMSDPTGKKVKQWLDTLGAAGARID